MLPNQENGKQRLIKACYAFTNCDGCFHIYGIQNNNSIPIDERMIVNDSSIDFPEHFGIFPKKCTPSVEWSFKNPPIKLPNGNIIHIVHLLKS